MTAMTTTCILWLLTVCAVGYALWTVWYLFRESRRNNCRPPVSADATVRREIIGKSRFVLDRRHSQPQAAVAAQTEKVSKKGIYLLPQVYPNTPGRYRRKTWTRYSAMFRTVSITSRWTSTIRFTKNLSRIRKRMSRTTRMKPKSCPFWGRSLAQGVSFEQMGEVYRHVVHDPPITDEQKEETGRLLLGLKETDMFEAIVSGCPDGNDKVKHLIDTYLSAFHRRMAAEAAESPSSQGAVPDGFDVRNYV